MEVNGRCHEREVDPAKLGAGSRKLKVEEVRKIRAPPAASELKRRRSPHPAGCEERDAWCERLHRRPASEGGPYNCKKAELFAGPAGVAAGFAEFVLHIGEALFEVV